MSFAADLGRGLNTRRYSKKNFKHFLIKYCDAAWISLGLKQNLVRSDLGEGAFTRGLINEVHLNHF